jgi:3-oxoacyl-[acyl-carrier protein] reductase
MNKRTIVITGGNRGIGKSIALNFAGNGDNVCIIGRDDEALSHVESLGNKLDGNIFGFKTDISSESDVNKTFNIIKDRFGFIDILVNNAGINTRLGYDDTTNELWNQEIAINLTGAFYCTQEVIKDMVNANKGWIVMMSSIKALEGSRSLSYGASKAGLISLTKSYARAVSQHGVRVNCIAPSMIETDMAKLWSEEDKRKYIKKIPVGRFGQPEEISSLVYFLCSKEADFISGSILGIDGGYFL